MIIDPVKSWIACKTKRKLKGYTPILFRIIINYIYLFIFYQINDDYPIFVAELLDGLVI